MRVCDIENGVACVRVYDIESWSCLRESDSYRELELLA